jgi:hypothetical protein
VIYWETTGRQKDDLCQGDKNMNKHLQNILKGIGSVMDVAPSTDYNRFVSKEGGAERMRGHWVRTGKHIQCAMNRFADEQKTKK